MTDVALHPPAVDTPRSAYRALERRTTAVMVVVLLALAAVAWWSTVGKAHDMSSMVQGLAQVGVAMPFDMSALVFIGMWITMMVAMMFPTIAPIVLLHRMVVRRGGQGALPSVTFTAGYIGVWALAGLVPLGLLVMFRQLTHGSGWVDRAGGAILIVAGVYQFTTWKQICLRACRTPLSFLMTHDFGTGPLGALRVGLSHGLYCLGCCWALMTVLFVVGLMNLAWMAGIAVVFLAEKNWRHGTGLTRVVGIAVILFGLSVFVHPSLLTSVAQVHSAPAMHM